jgi:lipoprotein-anchoring transpeptidase ErfK/SrfK
MKSLALRNTHFGREKFAFLLLVFFFSSFPLLAQEGGTRARRVQRERKAAPPPAKAKPKPKVVGRAEIKEAKERLTALGYWMTESPESFGHALVAFQKVEGLKPSRKLSWKDLEVLRTATTPTPKEQQQLEEGKIRVEVDLERQVLFVLDHESKVTKILPISSGNGKEFKSEGFVRDAISPPGRFNVYNKIRGWKKSALGMLYYPNYYLSGLAIHGSLFVPAYPDSHGCIRIPMYAAEAFFKMMPIGTEILIDLCRGRKR